jgi:ADP-heptose:LPS heptosyltransferase
MKRILIVRPDGIGDFVIFSAVLEKYKEFYAGYQIDILCHPNVRDLVIAIPFVNKVYVLDKFKLNHKKYLFYFLYILFKLNFNRYEKVIYPVYSPLKEVDGIVKLIQAKEKIAFGGDKANNPVNEPHSRNNIFNILIESAQEKMSEVDRNVEFIRKLGLNFQGEFKTKFWFLSQDDLNAQRLMHQEELIEKKYICLFPGAGCEIRYWNTKDWIHLIDQVLNTYPDYKIAILGYGNDLKPIDQILSGTKAQERIINLYGKTELRMLAKIIEKSLLLIGMETGAIHIAAALDVPNVCIIGGGHFRRFYPYGDLNRNRIVYHKMDCYDCNWNCIYDVTKCIKNIKVEDVFHEVGVLMNTSLTN